MKVLKGSTRESRKISKTNFLRVRKPSYLNDCNYNFETLCTVVLGYVTDFFVKKV
jgi:hypothetical protein